MSESIPFAGIVGWAAIVTIWAIYLFAVSKLWAAHHGRETHVARVPSGDEHSTTYRDDSVRTASR